MTRLLLENQYITCSCGAFSKIETLGKCPEGSNIQEDWNEVHDDINDVVLKFKTEKSFLVCKAFGNYHSAYGQSGY